MPIHSELTMKNMALVIPRDSGLPFASKEWQHMESLANEGEDRKVTNITASFLDVTEALASGKYDSWYFLRS